MEQIEIEALHESLFAPWVQSLGLQVIELNDVGASYRLPANADIVRAGGAGGGVICGQALAAAADTLSVLTLAHLNGRFRACTTTDLNTRFLRSIPQADVSIAVRVLSNGRRMATTQAEMRMQGQPKLCAMASAGFIYLED